MANGKDIDAHKVALRYARNVLAGKVVACKWVRLACQRHLDDIERWGERPGTSPFWWSRAAAQHIIEWFRVCPHVKGQLWAGHPIYDDLQDWQIFHLAVIFGWRRANGSRRFHTAYIREAKKNAKSTEAAGCALYGLVNDGEPGAEVYPVASNFQQASIVFKMAKAMVTRSPELRALVRIWAQSLECPGNGGVLMPLHSKSESVDGLSPSMGVVDEYHAHKTRGMFDIIKQGITARVMSGGSPLILVITTAGADLAGPCYQEDDYARKVLTGELTDDSYFAIIYTLDDDDDWHDERVWVKANPNLEVSVSLEELREAHNKAVGNPGEQANFLTKRMNLWVGAMSAYYNAERWRELGRDPDQFAERLREAELYVGGDIASRHDLASITYLFKLRQEGTRTIKRRVSGYMEEGVYEDVEVPVHSYFVVPHLFLPEDSARDPSNPNGERYLEWARQGWITLTAGPVVDFEQIKDCIRAAQTFNLKDIAIDAKFQAWQMSQELANEHLPMTEIGQQVQTLSEPMKELGALISLGLIEHDGNGCFLWMMGNVVARVDKKDNVYPNKEFDRNKIDGPVSLLLALNRAMSVREEAVPFTVDFI